MPLDMGLARTLHLAKNYALGVCIYGTYIHIYMNGELAPGIRSGGAGSCGMLS